LGKVSTRAIGFQLAPRINAAGRTKSAKLAVQLLMAEDEKAGREIALQLDDLNQKRREKEKIILGKAQEKYDLLEDDIKQHIIVLAGENWQAGLIGLIASRMCDKHYRPCVVINIDRKQNYAKGSARSIRGFNIHDAFRECSEYLDSYGGHELAAGMSLPIDKIDEFSHAIAAYTKKTLSPEILTPEILIDTEIELADLTLENLEELEGLAPFGAANPYPIISCTNVTLSGQPRIVGNNHLKLNLYQNGVTIDSIGFGLGYFDSLLLKHRREFSIVGRPQINEFRARRTTQIELLDIRFD